jgi:hypothetical protein
MSKNFFKVNKGITLIPQTGAPSDPSNGAIYYDSTLGKFRKYEAGAWTDLGSGSGGGTANPTTERFSGDASTTAFVMTAAPASEDNTFIYIDGVYQQKDTYSLAGNTITFSEAPPTGSENIEIVCLPVLSIGEPSNTTVSEIKLTDALAANVNRNYITNGRAINNTDGWATYKDAAQASPVDGTSGTAAGITFTRSTTTPLAGVASFLLSRTGAAMGEGVSFDFDIDRSMQAKVLQIEFDYRAISGTFVAGTQTTESDVVIYLVDKTNGTVIQPSTYKLYGSSSSLSERFVSNFQTASNSTSYRICFHISNNNSTAFGLQIDEVKISPCAYVYGTPITDWQSYTPAWTGVTSNPAIGNGSLVGRWRRVGDTMEVQAAMYAGSTTTYGSGVWGIGLPSGFSIDSAKITGNSAGNTYGQTYGTASGWTSTSNAAGAVSNLISSLTHVSVASQNTSVGQWKSDYPAAWANGSSWGLKFAVPIQGWGSSVQVAEQSDARTVACVVHANATAPLSGSFPAGTAVPSFAVQKDTHGGFNTATSKYRVPVAGWYRVSTMARVTGTGSGMWISVTPAQTGSASVGYYFDVQNLPSGGGNAAGSALFYCAAGDELGISVGSGYTSAAFANNSNTFMAIERLSQASLMSALETVAACYELSANSSYNSAGQSTVRWNSKVTDSHGMQTSSGDTMTFPVSGRYEITVHILANAPNTTSTLHESRLFKNSGTLLKYGGMTTTYTNYTSLSYSYIGSFVAGDYIYVTVNSSINTQTLIGGGGSTMLTIKRIGN